MRRILLGVGICLPLTVFAAVKDEPGQRRTALVRLHDDLRQAVDHGKLSADDRQAAEDAIDTLDSVTQRGRRETRQDRERVSSVAQTVERLTEGETLTAGDRDALRKDLKELHVAEEKPRSQADSRRRLRDAIQPASEDTTSYPAPAPAAGETLPGDNSAHGGWRKVPQP